MFLSSLPVLPNVYFLKCYSFVTPHSRRPILRKFFQHNFFSKMFLSSLPVLPFSYFSFHHSLSPTKSKFSNKTDRVFWVFLHKSILLLMGYPMIPISHMVISGNPPVTLTLTLTQSLIPVTQTLTLDS